MCACVHICVLVCSQYVYVCMCFGVYICLCTYLCIRDLKFSDNHESYTAPNQKTNLFYTVDFLNY
jgi:hypothetical protein